MVLKHTGRDNGMKKAKILFFLPAILVGAFYLIVGVISGELFAPKMWFNLTLLFGSGVLLSMGKPWGCLPAIGWFAYVMIEDYLRNYKRGWHYEIPEYRYCIPAIIFYVCCAIAIKIAPKNK